MLYSRFPMSFSKFRNFRAALEFYLKNLSCNCSVSCVKFEMLFIEMTPLRAFCIRIERPHQIEPRSTQPHSVYDCWFIPITMFCVSRVNVTLNMLLFLCGCSTSLSCFTLKLLCCVCNPIPNLYLRRMLN